MIDSGFWRTHVAVCCTERRHDCTPRCRCCCCSCCETTPVDAGSVSSRQSNQKASAARRRRLFLRISIAVVVAPRGRGFDFGGDDDHDVAWSATRGAGPARGTRVGKRSGGRATARGRVEHTAPFAAESVSSNWRNFNAGERRPSVRWVITTHKPARSNKKLKRGRFTVRRGCSKGCWRKTLA